MTEDQLEKMIAWLAEEKVRIKIDQNLKDRSLQAFVDLVNLNDDRVDAILNKHGLVIHENGIQIFPRQAVVVFKDENKN